MNKKILLLFMVLVLINLSNAQELLIQTKEFDSLDVLFIMPISKNNYYFSYYDDYKEETDYKFRFLNDDDVLEINIENKLNTIVDFNLIKDFEFVQIVKNNEIISNHSLNFCNNNGICEPCNSPDCKTQENELVCGDCEPSSKDNYCNIKEDNICDLDCLAYEYEEESVYENCFEDNFLLLSCSDYFGKVCVENQICNGTQLALDNSKENCCLGECVESEDIYIFDKTCTDFFWDTCEENEVCDGEEIYLQHLNQTCCMSQCSFGEIDKINIDEQPELKKNYTNIIMIFLLIILLILLVYIIIKKKLIKISLFVFLIVSGIFLISTLDFNKQNQITGKVVSQVEQAQMICDVAEAYNLPDSYLLAIAYKESRVNHFSGDGTVKISSDGGVGMMQVDRGPKSDIPSGPFYACGNSKIDGRQLDAKQLRDNIECGAIELIHKCNSLSCINNQKQYFCANAEINLPPKNVMYTGWDIAIRAYNGWGCGSDYYRSSMGVHSPQYLDLAFRIQSYVEDFRAIEKQFQGYCIGNDNSEVVEPTTKPTEEETEKRPTSAQEIEIPEDVVEGDNLGYYYINPSLSLNPIVDFVKISEQLSYGTKLVEYVSTCQDNGNTYSYCVNKKLDEDSKQSWVLDYIDEENEVGFFRMHTGYEYYDLETGEQKQIIMKFALMLNSKKAKPIAKIEYDEKTGPAPKPVQTQDSTEQESETEQETQTNNENTNDQTRNLCNKDELTVVLFGDSITQMHYDYGNYLQYYFNNNFDQKVGVLITQGLGGMRVDNQKSIDMFNNEILPLNPDIVLMWFGMNSLEDYPKVHQTTYQSMIETMLSKGITPILITTSPTCSEYTDRNFDYLNNIIQSDKYLASNYEGVYLIDFRQEFNKVISVSGCGGYFADGYHINSEGHDYFAQLVVKQFIDWKKTKTGPFNCQ